MRLPERLPLLRVFARDVVRGLRDAERLRGDADAAAVERRHRDGEALVLLVQEAVALDVRALDDDVVRRRRVEAELLLVARHANVVGVEDERGDTARSGGRFVRAREEQERARRSAPFVIHCFAPVIVQPSPLGCCARSQRACVGAGFGLGQRERADQLAARERRHEARLLLVGAEREDRQRRGARVDGDGDADTGVRARQLLEHEDVREEVRARAAVLLGHAHAHEPELGELREHVARETVLAIPFRRVRLDPLAGEVAGERLDLPLLRAQLEIHAASVVLGDLRRESPRSATSRSRNASTTAGSNCLPDWSQISSTASPTAARCGTDGCS